MTHCELAHVSLIDDLSITTQSLKSSQGLLGISKHTHPVVSDYIFHDCTCTSRLAKTLLIAK